MKYLSCGAGDAGSFAPGSALAAEKDTIPFFFPHR